MAEVERLRHMTPREKMAVDADGRIVVSKTHDVEPLMDAVRAYGDFVDRYSSQKRAYKMAGSIDSITASLWAKEWGCRIGSKEFNKLAMQRIKSDIDYRKFRVGW